MGKTFQASALRYLVAIEQISGTRDATGQELQDWAPYSMAYVSIEQLSGQERVIAQQIYAGVNVRMWTWFQDGIKPKMRVSLPLPTDGACAGAPQARLFDIVAALDPDGLRRYLQLVCIERVESGA
jgi:SPP1 family predicted phage head-tail adaptor